MKKILLILISISFLISSCIKNKTEPPEYPIDWTMPDKRSFYMGFTAFPYDITPEALKQSYINQVENGDILLTHFDHGVPWTEALDDLPFPNEVASAISEAIANKTPHHKVLLTATATDTDRNSLAKYW
ncbi:MAG TPA: hypothetical protein ENK75_06665, partial [Saprospiraceae bacterium]|nr:hypothetical protein [Saprospiraceae bacterium]